MPRSRVRHAATGVPKMSGVPPRVSQFALEPSVRHGLLHGIDEIDRTLERLPKIREFESERSRAYPWLDGATTRVPNAWKARGVAAAPEPGTPTPAEWWREARERRRARRVGQVEQGREGAGAAPQAAASRLASA